MGVDALRVMRSAVDRSRRQSTVQLPIDFVRDPGGRPTPLKRIGADGRGQGLRLKLYLSMTMLATKEPHHLRPYPASAYATMLDIDDSEGNGARRVNQAQRWLADVGFIQRIPNGTHPPHMVILPLPVVADWSGRWITLPLGLWSNGWIHVMSGRALMLYIVLRELTGGRGGTTADGRRKAEYGLSDETWARGLEDLQALKLAEATRVIDRSDPFSRHQPRLKYELKDGILAQVPDLYAADGVKPY